MQTVHSGSSTLVFVWDRVLEGDIFFPLNAECTTVYFYYIILPILLPFAQKNNSEKCIEGNVIYKDKYCELFSVYIVSYSAT